MFLKFPKNRPYIVLIKMFLQKKECTFIHAQLKFRCYDVGAIDYTNCPRYLSPKSVFM